MAPTKRPRPSFSPPRPSRSKSKPITKSSFTKSRDNTGRSSKEEAAARRRATDSSKRSKDKYEGRRGTRQAMLSDEDENDEEDEEEDVVPRQRGQRRGAATLIDDEASADDKEDDADSVEQASDEDEEMSTINHENGAAVGRDSSLEPDMILAEITHHPQPGAPSPIPEQLVHKMLAHHFEHPEKTRMSTDARDLVTKYFEVFVREAIMRSAFERQERDKTDGGGAVKVGGFLEVEDLERAAVQLCLDF